MMVYAKSRHGFDDPLLIKHVQQQLRFFAADSGRDALSADFTR